VETILYVIILALAVNLMANMIWKYLPYTDKRADVWVTIILIIVCVLIIISRNEVTKVSTGQQPPPPQDPPYGIKKYNEVYLEEKIGDAKKQVLAIGTVLSPIPLPRVEKLIEKVKSDPTFKVKLVMMNPKSEMLKARINDEKYSNYEAVRGDIENKLLQLDKLISEKLSSSDKKRMTLQCSNRYPTISVYIIDDNLYTYSYPHGDKASGAAVITFRKYADNPEIKYLADFFERHLNSIMEDATEVKNGKCK
jgi:hypothetical protein